MWPRSFFRFLVMLSSLFISAFLQADSGQSSNNLEGDIPVGALIPQTGALGLLGGDVAAGVRTGVDDFNRKLRDAGASWQIQLDLRDTATNPAEALRQLELLRANNISLILGPVSSASVNAIKALASDREVLLFSPGNVDADNIVAALNNEITELAWDQGNLNSVAVVVLSFQKIREILVSAEALSIDNVSDLDDLQWFGAARTYPQIINESDARNFAIKMQYTTVILDIDRTLPIYERVRAAIQSRQGIDREPDVHSYVAYDTVQILGDAIRAAENTGAEDVIRQLPGVAENYQGFVCKARLNENGDLMSGSYQRWQVVNGEWRQVVSSAVTFNCPTVMIFMSAPFVALRSS